MAETSKSKIAKGLLWTVVYNIVNGVYGFISVPMLLRFYGKDEYGLIGLALSINVYMQLMDLGFNSTNIRFFSVWFSSGNKEKLIKGFRTSLAFYGVIGMVNALVLAAVILFSQDIFEVTAAQNTILRHLLLILMVSAVINWYSSCFDQLIKATENVAWVQRRSLLPKLIQVAVLVLTVTMRLEIDVYFALTTFAFCAILPMSVRKIRREVPGVNFMPKWNKALMKEMLPYCMSIFSFGIFQFSFANLRPVFLGIQGTLGDVADYRILNGIIGIVTMFGGMFLNVLLPSTAKIMSKGDSHAFDTVAYGGTKYITLVVSFCCFGMMAIGAPLLTLYVGPQYLNLLPWLDLWLLCTLATHNQAISSLILGGTDVKPIAWCSAVSAIVGLVAAWFMIPRWGIGAIVWSFMIYLALQLLFYYLWYWPRVMGIDSWRVFRSSFMPPVLAGAAGFFATGLIVKVQAPWPSLVLSGLVFCVFFALFTAFVLKKNDRAFFRSVFRK